jgi:hypothetical protein
LFLPGVGPNVEEQKVFVRVTGIPHRDQITLRPLKQILKGRARKLLSPETNYLKAASNRIKGLISMMIKLDWFLRGLSHGSQGLYN